MARAQAGRTRAGAAIAAGLVVACALCVVGFVLAAAFSLTSEPCGADSCEPAALSVSIGAALVVPVGALVAMMIVCTQTWQPISSRAKVRIVWSVALGVAIVLGLLVLLQAWSTGGRYPVWW